jgi:hypothetical protein
MSLGILSACNDTSYIIKVDSVKYPVGPYAFYAYWMRDNFEAQTQYSGKVYADALLEDADDQGTKAWQMIMSQTKAQYMQHILINKKFTELGLSLTDEQKQAIETAYTTNWVGQYGEENLNKILDTLGLTIEEFKDIISLQYKNDALINYYFGPGGEKEIADSELKNKYLENYARFKYVILAKTDSEGNQLSFDNIAAKKYCYKNSSCILHSFCTPLTKMHPLPLK